MFYSRELFQAQGPLARVWQSANYERKLSKQHILQANLTHSIDAIVSPNQAPLALRVTGKLLLGVVRIYSRKARYLLDDCSEALIKLKMAFRPTGNHDIPTALHAPDRESLMLPDRITPHSNLDLSAVPDFNFPAEADLTAAVGRKNRANARDINLQEDFTSSQFLHETTMDEEELALKPMDDLGLELDFGMDDPIPRIEMDQTMDIEMGRDAPPQDSIEDDPFADVDMMPRQKDRADRESSLAHDFNDDRVRIADDEGDIQMGDDLAFNIADQTTLPHGELAADMMNRGRISESPLSDIDEDFAKQVEIEYSRHQTDLYEQEEDENEAIVRRPAQKARRQKLLVPDSQTILSTASMREVQANPSEIMKPTQFLPREPYIITLRDMQKNGGFVNNVMKEKRSNDWAPELKGMLSLESMLGAISNNLKRKRDGSLAEGESEQASKSPRLDLGDADLALGESMIADQTMGLDGTMMEIPADDPSKQAELDDADAENDITMPAFDETMAPIVHPAESGPVSLATTHAVHILRDLFGAEAEHDDEKRKNSSVVFQQLLPEGQTTKADATKMFFECLVLATKDAIKVEQGEDLGAPIRVRGKRGLWGAWAEREAGGEIEEKGQEEEDGEERGGAQDDRRGSGVAGPSMPAPVAVGA